MSKDDLIRNGWRQCATNQRSTQFCALLEAAVLAEREACAKACDAECVSHGIGSRYGLVAGICAAVIRKRGEK